jgi:hypothetical protein
MSKILVIWEKFMMAIRQWILMLALVCIAPLSLAEEGAMSTQQQCAEYGVYQDATENWIDCAEGVLQQNVNESYIDETYTEEPYIEESYVEEPYVEEPYVEDSYVEEPYLEQPYVEELYLE